jgi:Big-like domain-containing protein
MKKSFQEEKVILRYFLSLLAFLIVVLQFQCSIPEIDDIDPPVVTIIYPYASSIISGTTNVLVESTDDDKVTKVWLYIDDQLIESQNGRTGNFQVDLSPYTDDQQHMILAAAEDKSGNRGFSAQVIVTISESPDLVLPTVSIINPLANQQVQDTVKVLASAHDDRIVQNVAFFVNGDSVYNDELYPYEYNWVTTNLADSTSHAIVAKAFDQSGNWAVSTPVSVTVFPRGDRTPPVLTLLYPAAGSVLSDTVDVNIDASDNIEVAYIEFYVNGELVDTDNNSPWGFAWNTTTLPAGTHSLYVKGFDAAGNVGVIPNTTYTIADNPDVTAPTLTLLYPAAASQLSGNVNIVIDAIDDVGVTQVEYFIDGNLVSTDNTAPWEYNWNTAGYSSGSHVLFAKGYDAAGNIGTITSTEVEVLDQLDTTPPTLTLLYPFAGSIITGTVNVAIDATDNVYVDSVQFFVDGILETTDFDEPWGFPWNTAPLDSGSTHTLYMKGFDPAGNVGTAGPSSFTITN